MSSAADVLVLGAGGMLGGYLTRVLVDRGVLASPSTRQDFDILHDSWNAYPWGAYDVVVNALGAIPQKVTDPAVLMYVNGDFPLAVAPRCRRWIQVSTDCVFSGRRGHYQVDDPTDPVDAYGRSKRQGEVGLVVRGSFVGEGNPVGLLEVVLHQRVMDGYVNHWWNGVSCLAMAEVLADFVVEPPAAPLVHVAGPGRLSKHDLCQTIAAAYDHPLTVTPRVVDFIDRTLVPTVVIEEPLDEQLVRQRGFTRWTA